MRMNTFAAVVIWLWVAGWTLAALRELWCVSRQNKRGPERRKRE